MTVRMREAGLVWGWIKEREAEQAMRRAVTDWQYLCWQVDTYVERLQDQVPDLNLPSIGFHGSGCFGAVGLAARCCLTNGPISDAEARILNVVDMTNSSAGLYNERHGPGETFYDDALIVIESLIQFAALEQLDRGEVYDPASDRVITVLEAIAHAVFLADGAISLQEIERFSSITSRLREWAVDNVDGWKRQVRAARSASPHGNKAPHGIDDKDTLEASLADLHKLVGLESVKAEVETLANLAKVMLLRKDKGLSSPDMSFHIVFTGNPGTGKTTVARILARIYHHLNLVSQGHLVEVDRSGLVAGYIGQTAIKVAEVVNEALGGALFIDEAYALAGDKQWDFGHEAIATLLKLMEDNRGDLIVIAAGYSGPMEAFLSSNPGLRSRFARRIDFPDYTGAEMLEIFERLVKGASYRLEDAARTALAAYFEEAVRTKDDSFANGRDARNVFEKVMSAHANRIARLSDINEDTLAVILQADIRVACPVTLISQQ